VSGRSLRGCRSPVHGRMISGLTSFSGQREPIWNVPWRVEVSPPDVLVIHVSPLVTRVAPGACHLICNIAARVLSGEVRAGVEGARRGDVAATTAIGSESPLHLGGN
jgi:hypothetical protein